MEWRENLVPEEINNEVVLTYEPEPEPVVLSYEAPLPPAMCPESDEPAPVEPGVRVRQRQVPVRKKKRRRLILLFCLLALLAAALGIVFGMWVLRDDGSGEPWDGGGDTWDGGNAAAGEETTIAAYPVGGSVRLHPLETHGEILSAQAVYGKVNPSVVAVVTYTQHLAASGTGVIISPDGYIVTNFHVVEGGETCYVLLYSGLQYEAKLVGYDRDNDLAVLKVEADGLPAAEFGSSDLLTVGDLAYAIGNPLGLELRGTFTNGIISAIDRDVDVDGTTMTLIQTNAALNSGNSGGPLINAYGQVVGINTIKMVAAYEDDATVEGLGFAIPSSTVAHIVNCIISTGEVRPQPVLGITVMGYVILPDGTGGIPVIEVTPGLGGELAGMQEGDVIVSSDGEPISGSGDLLRTRRRYDTGEELPLTIYRDGAYLEVLVPLMEPPET